MTDYAQYEHRYDDADQDIMTRILSAWMKCGANRLACES